MSAGFRRRDLLRGFVAAFAATASPRLRASGPTVHVLEIRRFEFLPEVLEARAGDTVTWVNKDIVPHTATSVDGDWDTGLIERDERRSITLRDGMQGKYLCLYHQKMRGAIKITS